jgi:hypothetical protein
MQTEMHFLEVVKKKEKKKKNGKHGKSFSQKQKL